MLRCSLWPHWKLYLGLHLDKVKSLGFTLNYFTESDVKVFDVDTNLKGYSAVTKMLTTSFMN